MTEDCGLVLGDGPVVFAYLEYASSGLIIQHKKALDCVHAGLWVQSVSILGLTFPSEWLSGSEASTQDLELQ